MWVYNNDFACRTRAAGTIMRRRRQQHETSQATGDSTDSTDASSTASTTSNFLLQRVECVGVHAFRRIFAGAIAYDSMEFSRRGEFEDYFDDATRLHARFGWPLPHVVPQPYRLMRFVPHLLVGSAVCIGLTPRTWVCARGIGAFAFVAVWGHLFLCDASRYVNHYYLYLLVGALLLAFTISAQRRAWLLVLRVQFSAVYLFAGLAKCNAEWLVRGEPLRTYLTMATAHGRVLSPLRGLLDLPAVVASAAAFSLTFDLLVGFALWRRATRGPAAALAACFHMSNTVLFNTIGSFPFVSLASCLVFWPEHVAASAQSAGKARAAHENGKGKCTGKGSENGAGVSPSGVGDRTTLALAGVWVAWQALLPLRHHAHSSDVSWTKLGTEFGWRLMADTTDGWVSLDLVVRHGGAVQVYPVHPSSGGGAPVTLPAHAIRQLSAMPALLEQYVAAEVSAARRLLRLPPSSSLSVYAECWKSVNGRPYQRWCDPSHDWAVEYAGDGASGGGAYTYAPTTLAAVPQALMRSLLGGRGTLPPWMLARHVGSSWKGLSDTDMAAQAAASSWRAKGYTVEAFVDGGDTRRPAWRDRILRSAGYREAWLMCAAGSVELHADAPTRWLADESGGGAGAIVLRPGQWASLVIGRWHSLRRQVQLQVRVDPEDVAAWLYVMR